MYVYSIYIHIIMTSKIEKESQSARNKRLEMKALVRIRKEHETKYSAPLGQRMCTLSLSDTCLGTNDEAFFNRKESRCLECRKHLQRVVYHQHKNTTYDKPGRPGDSPSIKKKKEDDRKKEAKLKRAAISEENKQTENSS